MLPILIRGGMIRVGCGSADLFTNGRGFQFVPLGEDDDLIDRLLEHNPAFRRLLEQRLNERTVSTKDAARRL